MFKRRGNTGEPSLTEKCTAIIKMLNEEVLDAGVYAVDASPSTLDANKHHMWGFSVKITVPLDEGASTRDEMGKQVLHHVRHINRQLQKIGWICVLSGGYVRCRTKNEAQVSVSIAKKLDDSECVKCPTCSYLVLKS